MSNAGGGKLAGGTGITRSQAPAARVALGFGGAEQVSLVGGSGRLDVVNAVPDMPRSRVGAHAPCGRHRDL
ncbi:MAG: hypothetical protein IT529_09520 [Burkholderiales bacterium]|nr:hypothetical protein [Burkholderiales bacterium]